MSKARLVHVLSILQQQTNEHKALTLHEICEKLVEMYPEEQCSEQGVRRDLSLLEGLSEERALSVRIESRANAHNQRSYKAYHPKFGLNEARLVFDSVSISRFLSHGQKKALISQLEGFLSEQEVRQLRQRVQVRDCLMQNEQLPQTLQVLYQALDARRCLDFTYCKFGLNGRQQPVRRYRSILPLKVVWEKEHYYLIALNPDHAEEDQQRNYRVDRMADLSLSGPFWRKVSAEPLRYGQFDMFPAKERCRATFRLHRELLDMAFETFGTGIRPVPDEEKDDWVRFSAEVELSTGFARWVLGQTDKIEVLGPPAARGRVRQLLAALCDYYRD
ncbi:helix-turn-helix transcriptional regulator [Candidatus Allofournierella excrementavium]|uniref:helix-turn-helix transcriptional regulator n=1 Tax=Candidatus Allofournierella excrementavium TaxID=2838591 RepID=UPI003A88F39D